MRMDARPPVIASRPGVGVLLDHGLKVAVGVLLILASAVSVARVHGHKSSPRHRLQRGAP